MADKQLDALLYLLEDNDQTVLQEVERELFLKGREIIPLLERAWENTLNEHMHTRIEGVIQKIQFEDILNDLKAWKAVSNPSLLEGSWIVARYQYPELKLEDLEQRLVPIIKDIQAQVPPFTTSLEKVRALNHIIYDIWQFAGNNQNFFAPQNGYINHVLENRRGNPVSLAIVYVQLAQVAGIPVYGVNLPKNFILALGGNLEKGDLRQEPAFYVNPYNRGAVLGRKEIEHFLQQQNLSPQDEYFFPCSTVTAITRLVGGLIASYEKLGYPEKIKDLKQMEIILQGKKNSQ